MSTEIAQFILAAIATAGLVVWLVAFQFLVAAYRSGKSSESPTIDQLNGQEPPLENWLFGSVEVQGPQNTLMDKAVRTLAKVSTFYPGVIGPLKIVDRTNNRIAFERVGSMDWNPSYGGWYRQGRLMFEAVGADRTRIDYAIEVPPGRWLLGLGWAFQVAGLIALVLGCWLVNTYCVSSPNPAMRWQTIQMAQAAHFLWPPFVFGALYRQRRKLVLTSFEALIQNLPYVET
jgi:hypothetical protein